MRAPLKIVLLFLAALTILNPGPARAAWSVAQLRCESSVNPLGIDTASPRLSWVLRSGDRGQEQTAYQVQAASTVEKLRAGHPDLWDSGKAPGKQTLNVIYGGSPLGSGARAYWRVRAWDRTGRVSGYSDPAMFETGLLRYDDWSASWITRQAARIQNEAELFDDHPAPLFRKEFVLEKKVRRARLYVSGLGYYEARLNAERVGDHMLDPGWTSYGKRVLYSTYDITDQLRPGRNALGLMLGNGWFNPLPLRFWGKINLREHLAVGEPRAILQLHIEFQDGSQTVIGTGETWRASEGPILRNNLYLGEVYDARKEQTGWDSPQFDDSKWASARLAEPSLGPLHAQESPPIRITRALKPIRITEPQPGVFIFDLGQNFAGWARLRVNGPAGTRVRLRYGELLNTDGSLNGLTAVCGQIKQGGPKYSYPGKGAPKTAWQQDEYCLKGGGPETYTPRFTFHGFRYVEVTGFPGQPGREAITGLRLNSDVEPAGSFTCSEPLLNRIQEMVLWTELSNLFSVQSDCPHREKFGYGGDIVAASEMGILNFDMSRFYAKAVRDLADDVRPNGGFTETAPFVGISDEGLGERSGPIGWGTAHPLLQWQLYQYYGDRRTLEDNYDATARWVALLRSTATNGILDNGISDHESLVPKPRALTGTAFYYYNLKLHARLSRILGKETAAAETEALAETVKAAFNREFLQPGTGRYGTGTQASQAFALFMGLTPPGETEPALDVLVKDIQNRQGHLSTGIFGTKYMLNALTDLGRTEAAWQIATQRDFPGWGHMLERGATTLWEHWEFSDNTYSHNHPMFGSVSEWFYKALAGINPAVDAEGFDRIILRPHPVGDLKWVKASHNSVRGRIVSEWERRADRFVWHIEVPVGSIATVFVPTGGMSEVEESGRPLAKAKGVKHLHTEAGWVVLTVPSGKYNFSSTLN